jgi:guanosine-3',5'-bis(diphosphate) 3'-pyrophosphohydrolase
MLVQRAEEFARLVHRNQSYGELPYVEHLKEVYLTLLDFRVRDEIILAASWLHDSIEDTETTYETLEIQFGKEVADLVQAVTNEKGSNRKEILEKTALKIKSNEKALILKLADRIVNTEFSIDNNENLYKMYEKEFHLFTELLYNSSGKCFNYTLEALWMYLEYLYLDEDERLSID